MEVPSELAAREQWVIWHLETRKSKTTKVPHRSRDNRRASTTKPSDWSTLEEALQSVEDYEAGGIGFVFSPDDPYCGIDLDDCVVSKFSEGGVELHEAAEKMVSELDSYTELSPSGTGVHVIVKAELDDRLRNRISKTPWGGNLEVYDQGRYFTITGQVLNGPAIRQRALKIQLLEGSSSSESDVDEKWLDRLRRQSSSFRNLYDDGDVSEYDSHSEADLALCSMIAQALGPDVFGIDQAFRSSGLMRDKWTDRDYAMRTISRALSESEVDESDTSKERAVRKELKRIEVRAEAKMLFLSKDVPQNLGLKNNSLTDEFKLPDLDEVYRIDKLHPVGGNVLLIAAYKSGKTALTLGLLKALADETPFLGKYPILPFQGNVAVFNYEETETQWRRHARKLGIDNTDRVWVEHRRGQQILPLWEPRAQDTLVEWMISHDIAIWIMDPTVVAWQGLVDNENDNALVAAFTSALDQVKKRAGIQELMLTHHEGRLTEGRGRGATRLEDWMDAGWYLHRDDLTNQRSMWAKGRDVEIERFDLDWNEERWTLTAGQTLSQHERSEKVQTRKQYKGFTIDLVTENGVQSMSKLVQLMRSSGVDLSVAECKEALMDWAGAGDNPLKYEVQVIKGRKQYTFSIK